MTKNIYIFVSGETNVPVANREIEEMIARGGEPGVGEVPLVVEAAAELSQIVEQRIIPAQVMAIEAEDPYLTLEEIEKTCHSYGLSVVLEGIGVVFNNTGVPHRPVYLSTSCGAHWWSVTEASVDDAFLEALRPLPQADYLPWVAVWSEEEEYQVALQPSGSWQAWRLRNDATLTTSMTTLEQARDFLLMAAEEAKELLDVWDWTEGEDPGLTFNYVERANVYRGVFHAPAGTKVRLQSSGFGKLSYGTEETGRYVFELEQKSGHVFHGSFERKSDLVKAVRDYDEKKIFDGLIDQECWNYRGAETLAITASHLPDQALSNNAVLAYHRHSQAMLNEPSSNMQQFIRELNSRVDKNQIILAESSVSPYAISTLLIPQTGGRTALEQIVDLAWRFGINLVMADRLVVLNATGRDASDWAVLLNDPADNYYWWTRPDENTLVEALGELTQGPRTAEGSFYSMILTTGMKKPHSQLCEMRVALRGGRFSISYTTAQASSYAFFDHPAELLGFLHYAFNDPVAAYEEMQWEDTVYTKETVPYELIFSNSSSMHYFGQNFGPEIMPEEVGTFLMLRDNHRQGRYCQITVTAPGVYRVEWGEDRGLHGVWAKTYKRKSAACEVFFQFASIAPQVFAKKRQWSWEPKPSVR